MPEEHERELKEKDFQKASSTYEDNYVLVITETEVKLDFDTASGITLISNKTPKAMCCPVQKLASHLGRNASGDAMTFKDLDWLDEFGITEVDHPLPYPKVICYSDDMIKNQLKDCRK
nr:expressed protein [Hymenolepis microstoma]